MAKSAVAEMLREILDLDVAVTKKSSGAKVTDHASFWAGIVGALVAVPVYVLLTWAFGSK